MAFGTVIRTHSTSGICRIVTLISVLGMMAVYGAHADPSDTTEEVAFEPHEAQFVRIHIHETNDGTAPALDQIEVYGPESEGNLALSRYGSVASASSALKGYPIHQIKHLNDGEYGNSRSWVAAEAQNQWAQVELSEPAVAERVIVSRDRNGAFRDRMPAVFDVLTSMDGEQWEIIASVIGAAAPQGPDGIPPPPPSPFADKKDPQFDINVPTEDAIGFANLALAPLATPAASSALTGHTAHQIEHLNNGLRGNVHSWISAGEPSWAEIDLGETQWIYRVGLGSDSTGEFTDRAPQSFSILVATEYANDTDDPAWMEVYRYSGEPVQTWREFTFEPIPARWVRLHIRSASGGEARLEEVAAFGQSAPIPMETVASPLEDNAEDDGALLTDDLLEYAFLGEEHAWLKTYGRADICSSLVPYDGRVEECPRHVGNDRAPLPQLPDAPPIKADLDDAAWNCASRATVRVADPYDFEQSPLAVTSVTAGWHENALYLALERDRVLSTHAAVISCGNWAGLGVLLWDGEELLFNTYTNGQLTEENPVEGAWTSDGAVLVVRLPLDWFPDAQQHGLRVGLGMGGQHTAAAGRPVRFDFASFGVAVDGPNAYNEFPVRIATGPEGATVKSTALGLPNGLTMEPHEVVHMSLSANQGPIGPEQTLTFGVDQADDFRLHLFEYDPLERTLALAEGLLDRLDAKGLDIQRERRQFANHREQQRMLRAAPISAVRRAFFEARMDMRTLYMRDPDLAPLDRILFAKRHPFHPSHNYSALLDSLWQPGGGVYLLEIPRNQDRLVPEEAVIQRLYDAEEGIVRNPMASFDRDAIYFAHRATYDDNYIIYRMNPDGSDATALTDGEFHDYWPCPLPDGSLTFISTRCRIRFLCWRPQAAVLYRMDGDGSNIQRLSYANLTEWAPSVMKDGRIIWTRSEYQDKGADYSHTVWSIRPDGTHPELVFGNTILQPNGYANAREVPGTMEMASTLISHFGDLNGPIALIDLAKGRFNPDAITSITPEAPWPGAPQQEETFRDPVPISSDHILCSHAPRETFFLYVIDRYGHREVLHADPAISAMAPTPFQVQPRPPVIPDYQPVSDDEMGEFIVSDVYEGIKEFVARGDVKHIAVSVEAAHDVEQLSCGSYRDDYENFMDWYASPVDVVNGPYGWPSYVVKESLGTVPVESDGSVRFRAPAGRVLYFHVLDEDYNELQRMRSVVQLQPGEQRSCVGCHEDRKEAPEIHPLGMMGTPARELEPPPWGAGAFSYERIVQPVLDRHCASCHDGTREDGLDLRGTLDEHRVPASYRTLITQGLVHHADWHWNAGGNEKADPLTLGTVRSRLWDVLDAGHHDVSLTTEEMRRIKTWIDLNCPLWDDYRDRNTRPLPGAEQAKAPQD